MGANPTMIRAIGQVADDAANVATELPVKVGAVVEADSEGATSVTDADKAHLTVDVKRRLIVKAEGGAADNAAITGNPLPVGGKVTTSAPSASDGDVLFLSLTTGGSLRTAGDLATLGGTALVDGGPSGSLGVGGTSAADAAIDQNPLIAGMKATAAEPAAVTEGRGEYLSGTLAGRLRVDAMGGVADSAAAGTAELPVRIGAVAETTPAGTGIADGDKVHLIADLTRRLRVNVVGNVADHAAVLGNPVLVGAKGTAALQDGVNALDEGDVGALSIDLARRLRVLPMGTTGDHQALGTENPILTAAWAMAPATAITAGPLHDNDTGTLTADLYRRLYVDALGAVADDAANVVAAYPVKVGAVAMAVANPGTADAGDVVHLTTDLTRRLRCLVEGDVADAAAATTAMPLKAGGVAETTPAGTGVADGDAVHFITDLYRRLRAVIVPQVLTASWIDSNAVEADAYYPAEAGLDTDIYSTITLTGKVITGADNTSILTIEVTNDEDATPGNRDWKTIAVYDNASDSNVTSLTSAVGTTTTFAWSLNGLGFKYVRAKYDITKGTTNKDTVIIKAQYRSN